MKTIIKTIIVMIFTMVYIISRKERYLFMVYFLTGCKSRKKIFINKTLTQCFNIEFWAKMTHSMCEGQYRPVHSTDYDHVGFYGRPELFYLVGGFGWEVNDVGDEVVIYAEDIYDWHPVCNGGDTWYFVSPLPISLNWTKYSNLFLKINEFIGCTAFSPSFDGNVGISNCFWDWLNDFKDDKSFTSIMEWRFNKSEFDTLVEEYYYETI